MDAYALWLDFKMFAKNLIGVDCDIIADNHNFKITIDNYVIYTFNAVSINDFKFELTRFKFALLDKARAIYA